MLVVLQVALAFGISEVSAMCVGYHRCGEICVLVEQTGVSQSKKGKEAFKEKMGDAGVPECTVGTHWKCGEWGLKSECGICRAWIRSRGEGGSGRMGLMVTEVM